MSKFANESFLPKKSFDDGVDADAPNAPNGSVFCFTGGVFSAENGDGFDKLTDEAGGGDVSPNDDDDDVDVRSKEAVGGVVFIGAGATGGGVAVGVGFAIAADAGGVEFLCICNVEPIRPGNFNGGEGRGPLAGFSGSGSTV